jgi:hypothetical protein
VGPQHEHLIQAHLAMKNVTAGNAEAPFQIERAQHLPLAAHDIPHIRRIFGNYLEHPVAIRFPQVVPRCVAQSVRRARGRKRWGTSFRAADSAKAARTLRRPRRAPRNRSKDRYAWSRHAARTTRTHSQVQRHNHAHLNKVFFTARFEPFGLA